MGDDAARGLSQEEVAGKPDPPIANGLQMPREAMLDLARRDAEVLVERSGTLAREHAWDGEFREALNDTLMEDPPELGHPPNEVLERAVGREEAACWLRHERDFLAAGYNINS